MLSVVRWMVYWQHTSSMTCHYLPSFYCDIRFILLVDTHTGAVLHQLHSLLVQRRVEVKIACLVHQSLGSTVPVYNIPVCRPSTHLVAWSSSVHLLTEHWLFHGRAPVSGIEVSLLRDRACGTLCRLHYDNLPAMHSLGHI